MSLPGLGLQLVYAHFAWGMVLAACGVGLLRLRRPFPQRLAIAWMVLAFVACALPGAASPAYWLGLALHYPSGLLVACCAMTIWMTDVGRAASYRVLPAGLATAVVVVGALLYADSSGWLSLGLYVRGFGPEAAIAGLVLGVAALIAVARGAHRGAGLALLFALMFFAVLRLPTGNVWDAVLDPMLWLWAIFSLVARRLASRRSARTSTRSA